MQNVPYQSVAHPRHILGWSICMLFFVTHYMIRISPSVLAEEWMYDFHVSLLDLSQLSSLYFLTYTFAQPVILWTLSRFSFQWTLTLTTALCGMMVSCMASAHVFSVFVGELCCFAFFSAFAFISTITYINRHLSHYRGVFIGLTQSCGMMSGFFATNYLAYELRYRSWCSVFSEFAMIFYALSMAMLFVFHHSQYHNRITSHEEQLTNPISYPIILKIACYAGCLYYPLMCLTEGSLGFAVLGDSQHLDREMLAFPISMIFLGWICGGPIQGFLSDRYGAHLMMQYSSLISILSLLIVFYVPLSPEFLSLTLFCFGIGNTGVIGAYSLAGQFEISGRYMVFVNMMKILIGALLTGLLPTMAHHFSIDGEAFFQLIQLSLFGCVILSYWCSRSILQSSSTLNSSNS